MSWLTELSRRVATHGPVVRVVVVEAEGSAPREAGAAMLVWRETDGALRINGTIGGGALEYDAIRQAGALLSGEQGLWRRRLLSAPLGPALGQCCGGHVRLAVERFGRAEIDALSRGDPRLVMRSLSSGAAPLLLRDRRALPEMAVPKPVARAAAAMATGERPPSAVFFRRLSAEDWFIEPVGMARDVLYLYGAGHVGRAIVRALRDLPFDIRWVDTAEERFPDARGGTLDEAAPVVHRIVAPDPAAIAAAARSGAYHLVLTYSHAIDFAICHALLARADFAFAGVIGSATKRARFRKRLSEAGIPRPTLDRLVCPIGLDGLPGKEPAVIAVSVAAQLLQWRSAVQSGSNQSVIMADMGAEA